jgi:hypothetical protein
MDAIAKANKIVGTIGLPRKAAAPSPPTAPAPEAKPAPETKTASKPAPKPARAPKEDKFASPGEADLAVELASEHRVAPKLTEPTAVALVMELIETTRGVAEAPSDTRGLRLALAVAEALPAHTPASLTWALKVFIDRKPEQGLADAARELRGAITSTTHYMRLARFRPALRGAIEVIEQRRAAPKEAESVK